MNRDDWEDFDDLFMKEGYGGYYDFVECLRMYAEEWAIDRLPDISERDAFLIKLRNAKTLRSVERLLSGLYFIGKKKQEVNI